MSTVMVISPHPDDEAIGCGGSLCRHIAEGETVKVVFLTSGNAGGHGRSPDLTAQLREQEARDAAVILGIAEVDFWRQPDGAMQVVPGLVEQLRNRLEAWQPRVLYVTHEDDDHPDHRTAARLVREALSTSSRARKTTVRMFEIWTPFQKFDEVSDISPYAETKAMAIRAHKTQCQVMSFADAALGLNRYRGVMHSGWPAAEYAEVFANMRL
jgi:LmbE family N-acetylglucosaminyl deacetylase